MEPSLGALGTHLPTETVSKHFGVIFVGIESTITYPQKAPSLVVPLQILESHSFGSALPLKTVSLAFWQVIFSFNPHSE